MPYDPRVVYATAVLLGSMVGFFLWGPLGAFLGALGGPALVAVIEGWQRMLAARDTSGRLEARVSDLESELAELRERVEAVEEGDEE